MDNDDADFFDAKAILKFFFEAIEIEVIYQIFIKILMSL